ncbi:MAG TPA: GerMN domain-containing protein [Rectinemataceae bacterium]|nr:GerMN domain-containing protein [Rectinemataceae bacterium]
MAARGGGTGRGRRSSGGRDGGSAGCLLWLIVFSFIFLLFVLNWGRIKETLDRTNFNEIVRNQRATDKQSPEAPSSPSPAAPATPEPAANQAQPSAKPDIQAPSPGGGAAPSGGNPGASPGPLGSGANSGTQPQGSSPAAAAEKALTAAQPPKARPATLFFVRIDDDGVIVRQDVRRMITASDTPLTDALSALLAGPDESDLRQHLVSLIPTGTKLLGVRVQGTTAVVNLSEPFMYNHYGIEGYAGQLKQVVYTATAFPSVHDVQILIDGERHDYLGGEGVYIGKPLSRNSF